jgi:hypothetical protein
MVYGLLRGPTSRSVFTAMNPGTNEIPLPVHHRDTTVKVNSQLNPRGLKQTLDERKGTRPHVGHLTDVLDVNAVGDYAAGSSQ